MVDAYEIGFGIVMRDDVFEQLGRLNCRIAQVGASTRTATWLADAWDEVATAAGRAAQSAHPVPRRNRSRWRAWDARWQ